MDNIQLKVISNKTLTNQIDAKQIELNGDYNFKPHIGLLANGSLVMFLTHSHSEEKIASINAINAQRSLTSHVVMYQSFDHGITWGHGRHIAELMSGHEPSVSIIDGILFVKVHIHGSGYFPDPYAKRDYSYILVARSDDNALTFTSTIFDREKCNVVNNDFIADSRNIIKLKDGRLYFGIGIGSSHQAVYSNDLGITWYIEKSKIVNANYNNVHRSFFSEAVYFYTQSKRLLMLTRVDFAYAQFNQDIPYISKYTRETGLDNFDGEVLFESRDNGLTWFPLRGIGFPSLMYPSIVLLKNNTMLFTYTVREIPPINTGCIHPKVGVQAIICKELDNGLFEFDFNHDVIIIDDCTPDSIRNAGCFGNTIMLKDGSLVTPFSFPKIDQEILQLTLDKKYLQEDIFDHYASMQRTYSYRYADFINDDLELMELNLRRNFSALFLYAQCCNKGGIGTRVIKWELPF